ncbi:MAG: class I SAM-dependent methyltransferase, partial [Chloroflexi bacterium]|nr:class I SAM-dependent methyltransferase [Chloroflexota bacterium]
MDKQGEGSPAEASYDQIASWYEEQVRSNSLADSMAIPHLFDLLGDVEHLDICDLACGQGKVARQLAERGARVVGVDLSAGLLEIARRYEAERPLGITYLQGNAERLARLDEATFDGVVCHMALMDIPGLEATFAAVWRVLRPGGWFVFTITHPCFQAPHSRWVSGPDGSIRREVPAYFEEGFWCSSNAGGVRGQVGAYHRTLSTYLNALVETGFVLERVVEPQVAGDTAAGT